jgi:hypothetical protein
MIYYSNTNYSLVYLLIFISAIFLDCTQPKNSGWAKIYAKIRRQKSVENVSPPKIFGGRGLECSRAVWKVCITQPRYRFLYTYLLLNFQNLSCTISKLSSQGHATLENSWNLKPSNAISYSLIWMHGNWHVNLFDHLYGIYSGKNY